MVFHSLVVALCQECILVPWDKDQSNLVVQIQCWLGQLALDQRWFFPLDDSSIIQMFSEFSPCGRLLAWMQLCKGGGCNLDVKSSKGDCPNGTSNQQLQQCHVHPMHQIAFIQFRMITNFYWTVVFLEFDVMQFFNLVAYIFDVSLS